MNTLINNLITEQLASWKMAQNNYAALANVQVKKLDVKGITYKVQFNPARIVSSGAKVDANSIKERKCFLCPDNLPTEQKAIPFNGHYQILVNPFPIFPRHLTIPEIKHLPQRIVGRFEDMLDLAKALTEFIIFYNGPKCGASAPDHAHFQAGNKGFMPIEKNWRSLIGETIITYGEAILYALNDAPRITFVIESFDKKDTMKVFQTIYNALPIKEGEEEPMINVLAMFDADKWIVFVFPRERHRPTCYTAVGESRLLSSPASVDLGGVFITPIETDFHKITGDIIAQILSEVCMPEKEFIQIKELIKIKLA